MSAAQAILKDGKLLLPHDVGCGAEVVATGDPRYDELFDDAIRDEDLCGTPEENAALAARWLETWALEDRRTA